MGRSRAWSHCRSPEHHNAAWGHQEGRGVALGWQMGQWGEEGWGWGGFLSAIVCDIAVPMVCCHGSRAIKVPVVCHRAVPPCSLCHGGPHGVPLQSPWCGTVVPMAVALTPTTRCPCCAQLLCCPPSSSHCSGTPMGWGQTWGRVGSHSPPQALRLRAHGCAVLALTSPWDLFGGGVGGLGTRTLSCAPLCPLGALLAAGGAATNAFGKQ